MKRPNGKGVNSDKKRKKSLIPRTEHELFSLSNSFKPTNRPKEAGRGEFRKQIFTLKQKRLIINYFKREMRAKVFIFLLRKLQYINNTSCSSIPIK